MIPLYASALCALLHIGVASAAVPEDIASALAEYGLGQIVQMSADGLDAPVGAQTGTPIVMMHGMGDFADNPMGMVPIRKMIAARAGAYVHSVSICSKPTQLENCAAEDQSNGFFMTMDHEVDQFARVVRADPKLAGGFNAIGFSQGNAVIRGYIHKYNSPPVKNFVSVHGVLMGVAGLPQCPMNKSVPALSTICRTVDWLIGDFGAYTEFLQNRLAQVNYYRDPDHLDQYRAHGHFLPHINNEVKGKENSTYTQNFKSLSKLALVMAEDDTMIHPKESEHFGFFKDGSMKELVAMKDAPWYTEDWFGLKSLDEAKKIDLYSTPGNHLRFTKDFLMQMVDKYFKDATVLV